jgi:hypothetical protein
MIKNVAKFLALSSLLAFGNPMHGDGEKNFVVPSATFDKMRQCAFPLRSIFVEFTREYSQNGKPFVSEGSYLLKADISKNLLYGEYKMPPDDLNEFVWKLYLDSNTTTLLNFRKRIKGDATRHVWARIQKQGGLPFRFADVLEYNAMAGLVHGTNSLTPQLPMFSENGIELYKPDIQRIRINGEDAIKFSARSVRMHEESLEVLIFSEKSGVLLERAYTSTTNLPGKEKEVISTRRQMSDYFIDNGILFPGVITYSSDLGDRTRITINKKTAKMNPIIDEAEFVPKIPGGANVRDEINGIRYTTPIVGNPEAMKTLEADLNAYFEDADNEKAKTAPKPTTK